jgi:hypothetical protein
MYHLSENNTVNVPVIENNQIDTLQIEKENEIEINHDAVNLSFDSVISSVIRRNNKSNKIKNLRCK